MINEMTIEKIDLLERLIANRTRHQRDYEMMLENYQFAIIEKLQEYSEEYHKGNFVDLDFLSKPVRHTDDYDAIIDMLEMSSDTEFKLSTHEHRQYCLDQWEWKRIFDLTKTVYGVK
jgi:hypothetical protein